MVNYNTVQLEQNSWNPDGSPIIIDDCGHKHRSLSGALRCYRNLTRQLSDGMYSSKWYNAQIRHCDGSSLTEGEVEEIYIMERENDR